MSSDNHKLVEWLKKASPECIVLVGARKLYPPLADYGVSFKAPLLLNCNSAEECQIVISCLRGNGSSVVVQLGDSPRKIESVLESAEYGTVFVMYSKGRCSFDNLQRFGSACQKAFMDKGKQPLIIIISDEDVLQQHRQSMGLCMDLENPRNFVPLEEEGSRALIQGFVRCQNTIQNRVSELAETEESEMKIFDAIRISLDVVLQDEGVASDQIQEIMAPLDQWIEDFHEKSGLPTDPNEVAELFAAELVGYLCELEQPAILECRRIESNEINRLDNIIGCDSDYYYLPAEMFDMISARMDRRCSTSALKRQLNAAGLLVKEGQSRDYYTVKVKYTNVFGVELTKRRVRLRRDFLDTMGDSSLVDVFGKSEGQLTNRSEIPSKKSFEFIFSKQAINPSILITGGSGAGKTYGMNRLEEFIANTGGTVLVFNYGGTHLPMFDSPMVRIVNSNEILPIPLFTPIVRPDGSVESDDEVVDSILDMFENISKMGVNQRATLQEALKAEIRDRRNASLQGVAKRLKAKGEAVLNRYEQIFSKAAFEGTDWDWLEKGKILVLDFTSYNSSAQKLLTEFCASALWHYHRIWGQYMEQPLYLAFDEFQALDLGKNLIFSQILREGRKFHLALILATQSLEGFSSAQRATIMQPATRLFFRPVPSEMSRVARFIDSDKKRKMESELRNLERGECLAVGQFDGVDSPVKIRF